VGGGGGGGGGGGVEGARGGEAERGMGVRLRIFETFDT